MFAPYLKSLCFFTLLVGARLCFAQEDDLQQETSPLDTFRWQTAGVGTLGLHGTIEIPEGYRFLDGIEATNISKVLNTFPSKYEGMIAADDYRWLAIFQFFSEGYVDDSEKDDLDPHELLQGIQNNKEFEQKLQLKGFAPDIITNWFSEPVYNSDKNNLEWSLKLVNSETGEDSVLIITQILGRRGHMDIGLACKLEQLEVVLPEFKKVLAGFKYNRGYSYAEFQKGDKRAKYGLKGIVAGEAFHYDEQPKYLTFLKENVAYIIAGIIVIIAAVVAGLFIIRQTSNT